MSKCERILSTVLLAATLYNLIVIIGGFYVLGDPRLTPGQVPPEFAEGEGLLNQALTLLACIMGLVTNQISFCVEIIMCFGIWHRNRRPMLLVVLVVSTVTLYWVTLGPDAGLIWNWVMGH